MFYSLFRGFILRNPTTKNFCKKDTEEAINTWLTGARDRDGGRKKRQETTIESFPHPTCNLMTLVDAELLWS